MSWARHRFLSGAEFGVHGVADIHQPDRRGRYLIDQKAQAGAEVAGEGVALVGGDGDPHRARHLAGLVGLDPGQRVIPLGLAPQDAHGELHRLQADADILAQPLLRRRRWRSRFSAGSPSPGAVSLRRFRDPGRAAAAPAGAAGWRWAWPGRPGPRAGPPRGWAACRLLHDFLLGVGVMVVFKPTTSVPFALCLSKGSAPRASTGQS